jgi:hypothetical protein
VAPALNPPWHELLDDEDLGLVAGAINSFGEGEGHPPPTQQTIRYFTAEYVLSCLRRARDYSRRQQNEVMTRIAQRLMDTVGGSDWQANPAAGDERLRRLEREAAQGDRQARVRLILERVRRGLISNDDVVFAALLGSQAAWEAAGIGDVDPAERRLVITGFLASAPTKHADYAVMWAYAAARAAVERIDPADTTMEDQFARLAEAANDCLEADPVMHAPQDELNDANNHLQEIADDLYLDAQDWPEAVWVAAEAAEAVDYALRARSFAEAPTHGRQLLVETIKGSRWSPLYIAYAADAYAQAAIAFLGGPQPFSYEVRWPAFELDEEILKDLEPRLLGDV